IERWNRDLMRRVLFAGVRGGPAEVAQLVRAYRLYNLAGIGGFALFALALVGPGFFYILIPVAAVWLLSRPIEINGTVS
ncbi:MAG: hypothetical protein V2I76_06715, partial [Roseobacter sp.]|nr:hypothetical protein [Roseobacter sp.]